MPSAVHEAAAQQSSGSGLTPLIVLVLLGAVTYLMLIRPQRNRAKALRRTQAVLAPGAEVMTTAGLYATVVACDDDTVMLETSPGVHSRYARAAVARIITPVAVGDEASHDDVSPEH